MEKNRILLLVLIGVLLVGALGISFAYFTVGGKQDEFITFKSGSCLSITITDESDEINLESTIPETVEEGLNHTPFTFKIKNNCSAPAPYQISLESLNQADNSLGLDYIQVSLEDSEGRRITDKLGSLDETIISNENAYDARKLLNGQLAGNSEASYKLRMWLDYDATKEQAANKTYTSKIVVSAKDNVSIDEETIKVALNEDASTLGNNDWYKAYTTRVNVTRTKPYELKAKYCISNTICTPNIDATLTSNSFTIDYPNGSSVVCAQGYDDKGNSSKIKCNDVKKIDNERPTVEITSTTETSNSITINVSGSDSYSGIAGYKFSSDDGNNYTTKETTENTSSYTITDLDSETTYTIAVQSIDSAGNIAEKVTKEVTTPAAGITKDDILASLTINARSDFTILTDNTTGTIYMAYDDDGLTYYYAGAVDNNWVKFANMFWRIIRINGDGTIRLIYSGEASGDMVTDDNKKGLTTQINKNAYVFNSNYYQNEYGGYMYTLNEVHGLGTSSDIKNTIDEWYETNLYKEGLKEHIDINAGFCGDREPSTNSSSSNGLGGTGSKETYFGTFFRLYTYIGNPRPAFKCKNSSDLYTVNGAKKTDGTTAKGNQALQYPVGLISADEAVAAGTNLAGDNNAFYLRTGRDYWTMSPANSYYYTSGNFRYFHVSMYSVQYCGRLILFDENQNIGVRPVINLKADTIFNAGSDGTENNPYIVQ